MWLNFVLIGFISYQYRENNVVNSIFIGVSTVVDIYYLFYICNIWIKHILYIQLYLLISPTRIRWFLRFKHKIQDINLFFHQSQQAYVCVGKLIIFWLFLKLYLKFRQKNTIWKSMKIYCVKKGKMTGVERARTADLWL